MRAGTLRFVAALANPSNTGDAYSTKKGYSQIATDIRCGLRFLNGREIEAAKQTGSDVQVEIIVRPDSRISQASRLTVDSVTYEVSAVVPFGAHNRDWRLLCKVVS